jgi:hypothetical protein
MLSEGMPVAFDITKRSLSSITTSADVHVYLKPDSAAVSQNINFVLTCTFAGAIYSADMIGMTIIQSKEIKPCQVQTSNTTSIYFLLHRGQLGVQVSKQEYESWFSSSCQLT